ncbi:IS66 family insertion sequence element accessory protein TnpB [Thiocystis violacea]|uniref:IS66 family insertion sequence element accessory protein TnpB n=1 Tax=Thiocystis violacea TaxID=13725 RepID=UPI001906A3B1|nr:IS66 family insertion sequence element accessory protein TnpB [Thiocystis violacea]MBK1725147.1 hypothetical protein [Thiocystis violacea]
MLQLTPQSRVFVAIEAADFRRGIDGLAALCRQRLREDPFSGAIFVFGNRRSTALKLLCYDGTLLDSKRLFSVTTSTLLD